MIAHRGISCMGHVDTARVVSNDLCLPTVCNRQSITLNQGDTLIVAQVTGGRLPTGTTELPAYCELVYFYVEVRYT